MLIMALMQEPLLGEEKEKEGWGGEGEITMRRREV